MKLEVIKNNLLDIYQIDIDVYNDNNDCIILRPTDLEPKKGFYVKIEKDWKKVQASIGMPIRSNSYTFCCLINPPLNRKNLP